MKFKVDLKPRHPTSSADLNQPCVLMERDHDIDGVLVGITHEQDPRCDVRDKLGEIHRNVPATSIRMGIPTVLTAVEETP